MVNGALGGDLSKHGFYLMGRRDFMEFHTKSNEKLGIEGTRFGVEKL